MAYSPDRGIEYSLQRAVLPWGEAGGRECIQGILDRPSNEAPGQNGLCPKGCGAFGFWLRCSSGHRALRLCSPPRASPQAKIASNKLCSIPRSGEYAAGLTRIPVWKVMIGTLLGMAPL